MRFRMNHVTVHAAILMLSAACIPYTVGTTAQPVRPGESVQSVAMTVMPEVGSLDSTRGHSFLSSDAETRRGIDSLSDFGIRLVSMSGIVANYKRLVSRTDSPLLVALSGGGGFVNLGEHALFEATVLVSANERFPGGPGSTELPRTTNTVIPYAGLRLMQVAPLSSAAVHDEPTAGILAGVRFGRQSFGLSLEVGVFHDPSALEVRQNDWVVVPALVLHGRELLEMLRPPRGAPRFPF
jgi:hypothetical protein